MNKSYDINKLPKEYGILVFPISIARAENMTGQDPKQCLDYIKHFSPDKIVEPKVGLNMIYGDFLYFHSPEPANILKQRFMNIVLKHKNAFQKLVKKEQARFQIQHAFSYEVWNQMYLNYEGDFDSDLRNFKKIYAEDPLFQKYIKEDIEFCKREFTEDQINFFLEEHLLFYLLSKKKILLPNEYIQGREKWVLCCYPGAPLKGEIYTYQLNHLNLNAPENIYQDHFYDLTSKKLVDHLSIDLESYMYSYPE
jgi:hypothetical protein